MVPDKAFDVGREQVDELPETASRTIAAEWSKQAAGGSHIHPEWKINPCFHVKLLTAGPAKVFRRLDVLDGI